MRKIPLKSQGRIFSILDSIILATTLIVMLSGGLGVEEILEPALSSGGILNTTFGNWIGTGKGHALGLMFIICGILEAV